MRTEEYLAMAFLAGVGGLIVYALRKFNSKLADISTLKLWAIQAVSLFISIAGSSLLEGSDSIYSYILLIIWVPVVIISSAILAYRMFTFDLGSKK
jgi:hypothetical protein